MDFWLKLKQKKKLDAGYLKKLEEKIKNCVLILIYREI